MVLPTVALVMAATLRALVVCVVLVAALGGCMGLDDGSSAQEAGESDGTDPATEIESDGTSDEAEDDDGLDADAADAEAVRNTTVERLGSIDRYRFDVVTRTEGEDLVLNQTFLGVVDGPDREAETRMEMYGDGGGGPVEQSVQYVVVDGTSYLGSDQFDEWEVSEVDDFEGAIQGEIASARSLEYQRSILRDAAVSVEGTDSVGGQEVVVLSLEPQAGALQPLFGGYDAGEHEVVDREYRQYVAEDGTLHRVEIEQEVSLGNETLHQEATMEFDDFGEDFAVEPPEDATE